MMEPEEDTTAPRSVTSIWPALVLLAISVTAFVVARGYSSTSGRFPTMVAGVMVVLAVLDVWSRSRLPGSSWVETFGGTSFKTREMMHNPRFVEQAVCIAWIAGAFVAIAVIGILAAAPLFTAAFVHLRGHRSLGLSVAVGAGVLAFLLAIFEWALDYELYRGLAFASGGLSAW